MRHLSLLAAGALMAIAAGCNSGTSTPAPRSRALTEGETLGKIERQPDGAAAVDVQTLLSVTCLNGQMIVKTNRNGIFGKADCAQRPPEAALDAFVGKTVTITYTNGRLTISNVGAGSLELAAADASITDANATP